MATTWYFRDTNAATGPTGTLLGAYVTDNFPLVPNDKNTPKNMNATPGSGQVEVSGVYNNAGAVKQTFFRIFVSPALAAQTLLTGASFILAIGVKESSGSMNFLLKCTTYCVYLWRDGVGLVTLLGSPACSNEHGTNETECVDADVGLTGNIEVQTGDRIVVEIWGFFNNTKSADYTAYIYYDGTDTTMVDDTATTNAGSYLYCSQTLNEAPAGPTNYPRKCDGGLAWTQGKVARKGTLNRKQEGAI